MLKSNLEEMVSILSAEKGVALEAVRSNLVPEEEIYVLLVKGGERYSFGAHVRVLPDGGLEWARWNIARRVYSAGERIDLTDLAARGAGRLDLAAPPYWERGLGVFYEVFGALQSDSETYGMVSEALKFTQAPADYRPGIMRRTRPELSRKDAYYYSLAAESERTGEVSAALAQSAREMIESAGYEVGGITWRKPLAR
ncbi:MAG: hypothetical protein ACRBN8_32220 [Nannocystales bacterium]